MPFWRCLLTCGVLAAAAGGCKGRLPAAATGLHPDAVYYNGKVLTVDQDFSIAEAFGVLYGRFVSVGKNEDILAQAGAGTKRIDLQGRTVVPGLIDDHYHLLSNAGTAFRQVSLVGAGSFEEFIDMLRARVAATPPGEVIVTQSGWLPDQFGGRLPDKNDLDKVAPNNPLFVRGGHTMFLNSLALALANITPETRQPDGGVISRNPKDGSLTGELVDNAMNLTRLFTPPATLEQKVEGLRRAQSLLHSVGLTSIRDPGVRPEDIRVYQSFWNRGELTVRVSTNLSLDPDRPTDEVLAELAQWGVATRFGDEWLRLDGIGEFGIDGGFQAGLMRDAYEESPDVPQHTGPYYGLQRIPTEHFTAVIRGLNKLGWRACVHVVGDKGLDIVLDAYQKANEDQSIVGKRWTIEHGHVTNPDQFDRIKKLELIISSQFHTYMASRTMVQNWGKERGTPSFRTRDWLDAGLKVGAGTDWTLMPPNPFEVLYFLVTRTSRYGEVMAAGQRVSRQEALRLVTIDNAYITFEEGVKGSIEGGKLADFAVLDRDYLSVPDAEIRNIRPQMTVVGGKVVYEATSSAGR